MNINFRTLRADEIDVRVGTVPKSGTGLSLLLYKDARADMKVLDETVGAYNWQRTHELIDGQLFCNVSIFNEEIGQWVTKQDVGIESYTEKEKGRASDSFKRACTNWGIGRELYTAPFIWISNKYGNIEDIKKYDFRVSEVSYDSYENIVSLSIEMKGKSTQYKWKQVFSMGNTKKAKDKDEVVQKRLNQENDKAVAYMFKRAEEVGYDLMLLQGAMQNEFNKTKSKDLTIDEINQVINMLNKFEKSKGD